jgi:hypothetical protein
MSIPAVETISEHPGLFDAFDAIPADYPLSEFKTLGEFRKLIASKPVDEMQASFRLGQIFLFHYMHPLASNHPLLQDLGEIFQRLALMKIKAFVYVTPINHQAGKRFWNSDFSTQVSLNVSTISECVSRHQGLAKINFKDYSTLLSSEYFFHADNATEHLNENGRVILVERIASELFL